MQLHLMSIEAPYVTPVYAGLFGIMLVYLSSRVVALRNKHQVKMGDGGHSELMAAVRAQSNLLEYIPMALLLMLMMEMLAFTPVVIHALGLWLFFARLLHLKGMQEPSGASKSRRLGTRLTWVQMTISSLLCIMGCFGTVF